MSYTYRASLKTICLTLKLTGEPQSLILSGRAAIASGPHVAYEDAHGNPVSIQRLEGQAVSDQASQGAKDQAGATPLSSAPYPKLCFCTSFPQGLKSVHEETVPD